MWWLVCVWGCVDIGVSMRVPVVLGARVGELVPYCGVNVSPGVKGMAAGWGI